MKASDLPYTKAAYKGLAIQHRFWVDAVKYREEQKKTGTDANTAWLMMMEKFPIPAGAPEPAPSEAEVDGMMDQIKADRGPEKQSTRARGKNEEPVFEREMAASALTADMRESIMWVFNTIDVAVRPSDSPNTGAWSLRNWVLQSGAHMAEFYTSMVTKILPTRSDLNIEAKYKDDGRDLKETIERLLNESKEAEASE